MADENKGLMADPYAQSSGAPSWTSSFPSLPGSGATTSSSDSYGSGSLHIPDTPAAIPTPNFLFEESYDESYRRSWGERLTYHVGCAYLGGAPRARPAPAPRPASPPTPTRCDVRGVRAQAWWWEAWAG